MRNRFQTPENSRESGLLNGGKHKETLNQNPFLKFIQPMVNSMVCWLNKNQGKLPDTTMVELCVPLFHNPVCHSKCTVQYGALGIAVPSICPRLISYHTYSKVMPLETTPVSVVCACQGDLLLTIVTIHDYSCLLGWRLKL